MDKLKIIEKDINLLKEYPNNNRKHSGEHINKIAESIKRFGWRKPIEIDTQNVIIAGHGRLKAAKQLKLKTVPVVVNHDIELNNRAYRIFDNKITEAPEWDFEAIELEIDYLKDEEFDLESLGLDDFEIPELEEEIKEVEADNPDDIENVFIKVGDLIELDHHRVLCGDATLEESYSILMDGKKADMVFTDPPYGVDYQGGSKIREKLKDDHKDTDIYERAIPLIAKYCDGACYTWYADKKPLGLYKSVANVGDVHSLIIWVKNNSTFNMNIHYKQNHEPCLYWKPKGKTLNWVGGNKEETTWFIDRESRNDYHPTQKPLPLVERALKNHKANLILDSFLGSGSTLIASEQLGRTCYGMELEPKYCQVIMNRYLKLKPDAEIKINGELWTKRIQEEGQSLSLPNSKDKTLSDMQV